MTLEGMVVQKRSVAELQNLKALITELAITWQFPAEVLTEKEAIHPPNCLV